MKKKILIVGAGLAGCSAAAILREKGYQATVIERGRRIGGLCKDANGWQECGPHAFHTDDAAVRAFLENFAVWIPFALKVCVQTDPELREMPLRIEQDAAFRVYSEKAWGKPYSELPEAVRARVPTDCRDGREGYHAGAWKAQPVGGYSRLLASMADGAKVIRRTVRRLAAGETPPDPVVWTGDLNDAWPDDPLPWVGRHWFQARDSRLSIPGHVVNHATFAVPQIRSYSCATINPWARGHGVGVEFAASPGEGRFCYPVPGLEAEAARRVAALRERGVWCCGRLATYRYLDMDATIRNVMDTIEEAGL